ncbi:MAG: hypothetical protein K2X03_11030 [Bryobacteraceae bacterium]|nr:hypothetical protein [Bryobacteraceae bacterium]
MKSAREEFGPPVQQVEQRLSQNLQDLQTVRDIGQQLKQSGVTQEQKQANLTLVKNDQGSQSAHKDMGVQQGERPALSPCDGNVQANSKADIQQAGQSLAGAGVKQSAAQQFGPPAQTPSLPPPSQGRSR